MGMNFFTQPYQPLFWLKSQKVQPLALVRLGHKFHLKKHVINNLVSHMKVRMTYWTLVFNLEESGSIEMETELTSYENGCRIWFTIDLDILEWWKLYAPRFPIIALMLKVNNYTF